jgi:anti-sigma factor RsiW
VSHVLEELTALLDGALEPADRDRVLAHLAGCATCRAARDRTAGALAALARLPAPPEPSGQFEPRFYARLASQRAAPPGLRARLGWRVLAPLAAAGAAAALVAGLGLRDRQRERFIADHLDLFESYEAVASVGEVSEEDADAVAHLDELEGGS